ncbi:hypothetical protein ACLOJK_022612 [Asimina triloba]
MEERQVMTGIRRSARVIVALTTSSMLARLVVGVALWATCHVAADVHRHCRLAAEAGSRCKWQRRRKPAIQANDMQQPADELIIEGGDAGERRAVAGDSGDHGSRVKLTSPA